MHARLFFGSLLPCLALAGCATAVDTSFVGKLGGDASTPSSDGGADSTYPLTRDTGAASETAPTPGDDSASPIEDVAPDSGTIDDSGAPADDTAPPPPPDDTAPPPVDDTGPPSGAPCTNCSIGTCSSATVDEACLFTCLYSGYFDCTWDETAAKPCTCHD